MHVALGAFSRRHNHPARAEGGLNYTFPRVKEAHVNVPGRQKGGIGEPSYEGRSSVVHGRRSPTVKGTANRCPSLSV